MPLIPILAVLSMGMAFFKSGSGPFINTGDTIKGDKVNNYGSIITVILVVITLLGSIFWFTRKKQKAN